MPTLDDTLDRLLALPREAGTPAADAARAIVTNHLEALGYTVVPQPFTFSPATLSAFPVLGAGLGWLAVAVTPLLMAATVRPWLAIALWLFGLVAAFVLAVGTGLGWIAVRDQPRRRDANLLATRGPGPVPIRRWLVAHLDSKAQGHSMAGRLVAVWCAIVAIVVMTSLTAVRLSRLPPIPAVVTGAGLTLLAGALAGRGGLRGTSPGARDNGTGVAAVLAAAERLTDPSIGILITGAEEFGLIGSRIFVQQAERSLAGVEFVNVDTVDDAGTLALVHHDARGKTLAERLAPTLKPLGLPQRLRHLPLGILVDSLPFARAGAPAITIGRLTWNTLRRVHTPKDTPKALSLEPALSLGRALAEAGSPGAERERGAVP